MVKSKQNSYCHKLIERLYDYYGKKVLRIVRFDYQLQEIQIIIKPSDELKIMRDELLGMIETFLVDLSPAECVKIYFCYGFTAEKECFFINANELALNWIKYRDLDPVDYLTQKDYRQLKEQGVI